MNTSETSQEEDMAQNSEKTTNYPQEAEISEPLKIYLQEIGQIPCPW